MSDGLYRPKYRDRKGQTRTAKVWWLRTDPVSRRPISTGATTKAAAVMFKAERERLAADPNYTAANETTIGHWVSVVLERKTQHRTSATVGMYKTKLGHVVRLFGGNASMASINPNSVDTFVDKRREEGATNNTIGKELTAIHQLCKFAKRGGAYPGDIKALKPIGFDIEYTPRVRVLSDAELDQLRDDMPPDRFAAVALFVSTSCRDSEAKAIRPEHYDAQRHLLHIPGTKTAGAKRTVPIVPFLRPLFAEALPHLPIRFKHPGRLVTVAAKRLGLRHVSANDLRRTCASRLIASGVSFAVAAKILGHVDARMLERVYTRLTDDQLAALAEAQAVLISSKTPAREFGICLPGDAKESCFNAVAPPGLEPGYPLGSRILKPREEDGLSWKPRKSSRRLSRRVRPWTSDSVRDAMISSKTLPAVVRVALYRRAPTPAPREGAL